MSILKEPEFAVLSLALAKIDIAFIPGPLATTINNHRARPALQVFLSTTRENSTSAPMDGPDAHVRASGFAENFSPTGYFESTNALFERS